MPSAEQPQPLWFRPGTTDEENLAVSLMMLSRGNRDEHRALCSGSADVVAAPAPPYVVGDPAGVAHGSSSESVFLQLSQAPVVAANRSSASVVAASRSSASVAVAAQSQPPARVAQPRLAPVIAPRQAKRRHLPPLAPVPVVVVSPSLTLELAVGPIQAPAAVIVPRQARATLASTTQAQEPTVTLAPGETSRPVTAPSRASMAAPIPRTAAAPHQAPETAAAGSSQLLHECPICGKTFKTSRGLNTHITCHPDGRLHPCEFCMSTFPSTSALRSHVRCSRTCGGNNRRRLGPVAAAAIAWHSFDLNMPEI